MSRKIILDIKDATPETHESTPGGAGPSPGLGLGPGAGPRFVLSKSWSLV